MSCTLKIEPHIRSHIASCNGRVDRVGAKAEQCGDHTQNANDMAVLMDAQVKRDRERKRQELENFKMRVRQREYWYCLVLLGEYQADADGSNYRRNCHL